MPKPRNKAGTSKFILALGTLAAFAVIGGVIYQSQVATNYGPEYISLPQPVAEPVNLAAPVPEAFIAPPADMILTPDSSAPVAAVTKLPSIDNSDGFIRDRMLVMKHAAELEKWLSSDDLVRRSASYVDGLARGLTLHKVLPLTPPEGSFATHTDGEVIWLNAGNYERYDTAVEVIASLNMQSLAQMFHFTRPLLESAFAEMGYQPRQMDGIILQALDNILATPIIVEPIQLKRESVAYKFTDPNLEGLLPLQKQLLRAGPANTQRIQEQTLALQEALLRP
tara:strand:- start:5331 stop:6173 length:843 start_codon:yes stop_codon:yes gene_type:complete